MEYSKLQLIYTPTVSNKLKKNKIKYIEDMGCWFVQPKVNGYDIVVYCNGKNIYFSNKKGFIEKNQYLEKLKEEILTICQQISNKWLIFSSIIHIDNDDKPKLFIYDLYVYNSEFYTKINTLERVKLLKTLFKSKKNNLYYSSITENINLLEIVIRDFKFHYNNAMSYDYFDGLILRLKDSPLESLSDKKNNIISNLKCN
jgi:hypothetical protein